MEELKKKRDVILYNSSQELTSQQQLQLEKEAEKDLDNELEHQRAEAETRNLANAMLSDGEKEIGTPCFKLLSNYQGMIN